jgi:hypothetical protein
MAILGQNLDYTDKDFDSLRVRLYNLISGVFPTWTSQQIANFGNILLESHAFVGDVLGKYQDNQARESRWTQATQRKNLLGLAKLISYEPPGATASQVDVTISTQDGSAVLADATIEAETVCRTESVSDPVVFRTLTDNVIPAGQSSVTVTVENSEPQEDVFAATGSPDFEVVLGSTPYLDASAVITAGNGVFSEVDNFLESTSSDLHFTVTVDQNDRATIRFGDGVNGAIPTGTITAIYKTGGGAAGQVEAGTVNVIEGIFSDDFGNTVNLVVTNAAASTPSTDRATNEQIQENAPASIRVLNRTVAREDYEINALKLVDCARALMLTSNEDPAIGENAGFLFPIPVGGGLPTQDLKDRVLEQVTVTFPNTLTFNLTVADPLFLSVDITTTVFLNKGAVALTVDTLIRANIAKFFVILNEDGTVNTDIDFGFNYVETTGDPEGKLPFADIYNVIRDTDGVRKLDDNGNGLFLNGDDADITLLLREFPTVGTITIINGETGSPLV